MPTAAISISWLGALGWLAAIAAASFLVAWVLTGLLGVRRTPYIAALALVTGGLTVGYLAWSDTGLASFATNRWGWGAWPARWWSAPSWPGCPATSRAAAAPRVGVWSPPWPGKASCTA